VTQDAGPDKVSGKALYAADVLLPGMLWGKVLRSPYPHAHIRRIDTARARQVPGVHAVLTGQDLPDRRVGRLLRDIPVLARDRVLFVGEKVAAVAAETLEAAAEALTLIDVVYEELPPVFDPVEAMHSSAPTLHPQMASYQGLPQPVATVNNVFAHNRWSKGDIAEGFGAADRIFEHTFTAQLMHQGYIEPHACVVHIDDHGRAQVWANNKGPFMLREQLAAVWGVSTEQINVNPTSIGGDFGGKGSFMDVPLCYYLALHSRRPVKMVMDYIQEFMAGNPRHPAIITLKTGVTRDGRILARQARVVFNSGAYGAFKPRVYIRGADHSGGPYRIPHVHIESSMVYTNNVPCGHMRAPGQPQNVFASESHLDLIARELGITPLELRRRNVARAGDPTTAGEPWHGPDLGALLDRAAGEIGAERPRPAGRGIGFALGVRHVGRGSTTISLRLEGDGTIEARTGVGDQGGGQHTLIQRIVAATMGVDPRTVRVRRLSTEGPQDPGIGGSRVTPVHGGAALAAALLLKEKLGGQSVAEAARALGPGEGLEASATFDATAADHGACAHAIEVAVDAETGTVRVLSAVLAVDVGQVINPVALRGQLEGGFVYGLGMALTEDLALADGRVRAANLGDYKLPTIADVPPVRVVLLTEDKGGGPFGAKSVGELVNPAVGPAVANAIESACGVRVKSLPLTAEKVLAALKT